MREGGRTAVILTLLKLFWSFVKIGFTSFGGLSMIPLISHEVVSNGWMSLSEVSDIVAIAEMTPGPIALNAATFVGTRIAGTGGALLATFGCILPSCILVPLLAYVYERNRRGALMQGTLAGLRTAVVALIASAALSMLDTAVFAGGAVQLDTMDWVAAVSFLLALLAIRKWKLHPVLAMVACGLVSLVIGVCVS